MIALRERLAGPADGIPLQEVALGMGLSLEEAQKLLLQVRSESGCLTNQDLARLRQPPRLAITALITVVLALGGIWGYFQFLYR